VGSNRTHVRGGLSTDRSPPCKGLAALSSVTRYPILLTFMRITNVYQRLSNIAYRNHHHRQPPHLEVLRRDRDSPLLGRPSGYRRRRRRRVLGARLRTVS
jgi:hypothetical protein